MGETSYSTQRKKETGGILVRTYDIGVLVWNSQRSYCSASIIWSYLPGLTLKLSLCVLYFWRRTKEGSLLHGFSSFQNIFLKIHKVTECTRNVAHMRVEKVNATCFVCVWKIVNKRLKNNCFLVSAILAIFLFMALAIFGPTSQPFGGFFFVGPSGNTGTHPFF